MRARKYLRQGYNYPKGANHQAVNSKMARKPWNITVVHTNPTGISRSTTRVSRELHTLYILYRQCSFSLTPHNDHNDLSDKSLWDFPLR